MQQDESQQAAKNNSQRVWIVSVIALTLYIGGFLLIRQIYDVDSPGERGLYLKQEDAELTLIVTGHIHPYFGVFLYYVFYPVHRLDNWITGRHWQYSNWQIGRP